MKIRIWNAFASNNSGSYVIVGSFPSEALAAEVASELLEVSRAHSDWAKQPEREGQAPLQAFAAKHGLPWDEERGDDWPEHSNKDHPDAWAVGHQVFIHSDYTATMPRLLGHYFYARGGRVETEINHAHHPIVAVLELWIPWQERPNIDVPGRVQDIVDALCADDGPLSTLVASGSQPAWRAESGFGHSDLVVGAVFEDLCAGFTAVERICRAQGAAMRVRLFEAWSEEQDPLQFLRPCSPPCRRPGAVA